VATLEDGLYVDENRLEDAEFVDAMARFVRASMKGWEYARENPEEAAMIVLENDASGAQTEEHQVRMMGEIAKLLDTGEGAGRLDPAAYEQTVETLLSSGGDSPVISEAPEGAWTHIVVDEAGL
jgi:NitT/TauT family transport system substrate-binding protein